VEDLLPIRAGSIREAVATAHPVRVVVRRGRVVARITLGRVFLAQMS
jgi:hypothetical protein